MKKAKKVLLLVLCAVMLAGASVAGTLAYLTSQDSVSNTFTVGKVSITMDETDVDAYGKKESETPVKTNAYKLIPGHTYTKDPTIHVQEDSEACWLFVKIVNGNTNAVINGLDTNGWTQIGATDYWAYAGATVGAGANVKVFDSFTYSTTVTSTESDAKTSIDVTAYAIQADGFATSALAWNALAEQLDPGLA